MFGYEPEYIDCGDARIACYDIGRGRPLILLHGNGEDSSYWNAQISEFTRFMRVILATKESISIVTASSP